MPQSNKPAVNQVVGEPFRSILQDLRRNHDARLPMVLKLANLNGWTLRALGDVLGITREGVRLKVAAARLDPKAALPDVPLAPRRTLMQPKTPKPKLHLSDATADQLREMYAVARTVGGKMPANDPARTISTELTAMMASLVEQGISAYAIAQALDVRANTVKFRLARHGYRQPPPSMAHITYTGKQQERRAACKQGHPLAGDNLYVAPKNGNRNCKTCAKRRSAEYYARKRAAAGPGVPRKP